MKTVICGLWILYSGHCSYMFATPPTHPHSQTDESFTPQPIGLKAEDRDGDGVSLGVIPSFNSQKSCHDRCFNVFISCLFITTTTNKKDTCIKIFNTIKKMA